MWIRATGRRRAAALTVALLAGLTFTGCGTDPETVVQPLAKAGQWRGELSATVSGTAPVFGVLEVAFDRPTAERAWQENAPAGPSQPPGLPAVVGVYGDLRSVDFDRQAVVVWSAGQSGSCPGWLADVHVSDGRVELRTDQAPVEADGSVAARPAEYFCTDDYHPYRMLLAVDLQRLPAAVELPTLGCVDGLAGAVVTAYPASEVSGDLVACR